MKKTDEQLMLDFQQGDQAAFGLLYERLYEPLYCFLIRYTAEIDLSVDTVHDTFEQLQKKKHLYDVNKGKVKAFTFQIAYRLLINTLNRRKKWHTLLPFLVRKEIEDADHTNRLAIEEALQQLSENQRAVIILAYYEDATQEEIAQILQIPIGTVKSRLHHAMKSLKQILKEEL